MTTYQTKDGEIFEATSLEHLMQQMYTCSPSGGQGGVPFEKWLGETAERASYYTGKSMDGSSPKALAKDLIATGMLIQK